MGGGEFVGDGDNKVEGSDGQRACVFVMGVSVCIIDVSPLRRRRYCLRLYRK